MKDVFDLIGRILLSATFLLAAYQYIDDFQGIKQMMITEGVNFRPKLLLRGAIGLNIIGGLLLLFGYRAKLGAALLLIFLIPATVLFYTDNLADNYEQTMLVKNVAIIGGLLMVFVNGSGKYSVRKLLASTTS